MFEVIKGAVKSAPDYQRIYLGAFVKKVSDYANNPDNQQIIKQIVYYGVKWANATGDPEGDEEAITGLFNLYTGIMDYIGDLTPAEFITVFPIEKSYDGDKWGVKDYFYTMAELHKIGMNERIGAERVFELLWDYENPDTHVFLVRYMSIMSALRQFQGHPDMMEEWADKNGIETFTRQKDEATGQEYIQSNKTGKTVSAKKPVPRYMKVVK